MAKITYEDGVREAANKVKVMGGWYGLEEKQTDDVANEVLSLIEAHEGGKNASNNN